MADPKGQEPQGHIYIIKAVKAMKAMEAMKKLNFSSLLDRKPYFSCH